MKPTGFLGVCGVPPLSWTRVAGISMLLRAFREGGYAEEVSSGVSGAFGADGR